MKSLLVFAFFLSLAGLAHAQSVTERAANTLGMTPSTESFIKTVAISDMFEIEFEQARAAKGRRTRARPSRAR